jgi:beta-glucanase (GH16 family)
MIRRLRPTLVLCGALAFLGCASTAPTVSATPPVTGGQPPAWTLAWSDEFDGAAGAPVDASKWVAETGGDGWGNREREYYTTSTQNASLDGAGHLVITAIAEPASTTLACWYGPCRYTSARLRTKGRYEPTYGRFEARMRLPRGQGMWPAFWLLGANCDSVGWPQCGEIDVMENVGSATGVVLGTMHGPGYSGGNGIGGNFALAVGSFADDFHVFTVEWGPGLIRWLVDDKEYRRTTPSDLPVGAPWVFDHSFYLLLNLAVGGGLPGDPDASTTFPQQVVVDYVRVYRQ